MTLSGHEDMPSLESDIGAPVVRSSAKRLSDSEASKTHRWPFRLSLSPPRKSRMRMIGRPQDGYFSPMRTALRPRAVSPFDDVGSGDLQCGGDGLHGESPGLGERDSKVCFFAREGPELL